MNSADEDILANVPDDPSGYFSEESEDDEVDMTQAGLDMGREKN
uniref:Coiled-coil domain-containing protein 132 n=1 Tax=Triatoma infestans TaxID=30076 RepID=A0A161MDF5_TRIIF